MNVITDIITTFAIVLMTAFLHKVKSDKDWRKTSQYLLPGAKPVPAAGKYDLYPAFNPGEGQISEGFETLADIISQYTIVLIDGYGGVFYDFFREELNKILIVRGLITVMEEDIRFL